MERVRGRNWLATYIGRWGGPSWKSGDWTFEVETPVLDAFRLDIGLDAVG